MNHSSPLFKRTDRIAALIRQELSEIIRLSIKDPRLPPFVSITSVDVAKDLSRAKIYISVIGDEEKQKLAVQILNQAAKFLRVKLCSLIELRVAPQLIFYYDKTLAYSLHMETLATKIREELAVSQYNAANAPSLEETSDEAEPSASE